MVVSPDRRRLAENLVETMMSHVVPGIHRTSSLNDEQLLDTGVSGNRIRINFYDTPRRVSTSLRWLHLLYYVRTGWLPIFARVPCHTHTLCICEELVAEVSHKIVTARRRSRSAYNTVNFDKNTVHRTC